MKITKAEKQMVRAIIALSVERGIGIDAHMVEVDMKNFFEINNTGQRYLIKEYAQEILDKKHESDAK